MSKKRAEANAGPTDMLISNEIVPGPGGPALPRKPRPWLGDIPVMFISGDAESDVAYLLEDEKERVRMSLRAE